MRNRNIITDTRKGYSDLLKYAALILIADSTSQIPRIIEEPIIFSYHKPVGSQNSTRFNDSNRYSLEKLKLNKQTLFHLKNLKSNWNGYNSKPINEEVIQITEDIISQLDYQPKLFPTGRGTIQIEFFKDENNLLEIEVFEKELFMYKIKNGEEMERNMSFDDLPKVITEFHV
ncbi:hypothetical protein MMU07_08390 [Aquiflexum sp. LQ15W]|uniref:hypothetical protein n=1 Tax=Cognataquiflexum nitidum TaxID=2922272 RepID=UPI001F12A6EE|nr:hypothetical protein [Cognataquiflexum nitidum]MCH6199594.1 hypothetical protein [Cognataquiflexum nitidum]